MEEKDLMKKNKTSFFMKIKYFFKRIFGKKEIALPMPSEQPAEVKREKNISEFEKMREKQKLISIQDRYESGYILEKDLTEDETEELMKLYKEQIKTLQENIERQKNNLTKYKEQILNIKERLENA